MPALTLFTMATNMAIRNVSHIMDFSDMPWEMAKPVLKKVDNPYQLYRIELNCPQYCDEDEELWQAFIKRDFPTHYQNHDFAPPRDGRSWYLVYFGIQQEEKQKQKEQEAELKKSLKESAKVQNEVNFVDKVLPTPREPPKHDPHVYNPKAYAMLDEQNRRDRQAARSTGTARSPTRGNAKTGKDMIAALRRESAKRSKSLALTAHQQRAVKARQLQRQVQQVSKQSNHDPAPAVIPDSTPAAGPKTKDSTSTDANVRNKLEKETMSFSRGPKLRTQFVETNGVRDVRFARKRLTTAQLVEEGQIINNTVQRSISEREAKLKAIKANAIPRPETPPPPSPKIHIPTKLPFDAVITTSTSPTGTELTTTKIEETLPPSQPKNQPLVIIQKRKAPVNPFMPNKKRMI